MNSESFIELNELINKANNVDKLEELKYSVRVAKNRGLISDDEFNKLNSKKDKKIFMLKKLDKSNKMSEVNDADYMIKKTAGKEVYDVYVNDKKVKTFGSLPDAQRYVKDFKLGRVKDSVPKKVQKVSDANIRVDIDKLSDYLWLWTDTRSLGNPFSELLNELMDEAWESGIRDRKEAHEYAKKNYKKYLDKIYSDLKKSVDKKLRDGYNAGVKAFESL